MQMDISSFMESFFLDCFLQLYKRRFITFDQVGMAAFGADA